RSYRCNSIGWGAASSSRCSAGRRPCGRSRGAGSNRATPMSHQVNRSTMARQSRANPASRQESRRGNSSSNKQRSQKGYDHRGFTVWILQKMAQEKHFKELDDLFDNGLTMNALPVGMAAGTAARVFDIDIELITQCLDSFVSKLWRGKIFFSSNNKRV